MGWGWRIGAGYPVGSVCPFCLSENWNDPLHVIERSPGQKVGLVLFLMFLGNLLYEALAMFDGSYLGGAIVAGRETIFQWAVLLLMIPLYRRWSVHSR